MRLRNAFSILCHYFAAFMLATSVFAGVPDTATLPPAIAMLKNLKKTSTVRPVVNNVPTVAKKEKPKKIGLATELPLKKIPMIVKPEKAKQPEPENIKVVAKNEKLPAAKKIALPVLPGVSAIKSVAEKTVTPTIKEEPKDNKKIVAADHTATNNDPLAPYNNTLPSYVPFDQDELSKRNEEVEKAALAAKTAEEMAAKAEADAKAKYYAEHEHEIKLKMIADALSNTKSKQLADRAAEAAVVPPPAPEQAKAPQVLSMIEAVQSAAAAAQAAATSAAEAAAQATAALAAVSNAPGTPQTSPVTAPPSTVVASAPAVTTAAPATIPAATTPVTVKQENAKPEVEMETVTTKLFEASKPAAEPVKPVTATPVKPAMPTAKVSHAPKKKMAAIITRAAKQEPLDSVAKKNAEPEELLDKLVLPEGAELIAGNPYENEFFIIDKSSPEPLKQVATEAKTKEYLPPVAVAANDKQSSQSAVSSMFQTVASKVSNGAKYISDPFIHYLASKKLKPVETERLGPLPAPHYAAEKRVSKTFNAQLSEQSEAEELDKLVKELKADSKVKKKPTMAAKKAGHIKHLAERHSKNSKMAEKQTTKKVRGIPKQNVRMAVRKMPEKKASKQSKYSRYAANRIKLKPNHKQHAKHHRIETKRYAATSHKHALPIPKKLSKVKFIVKPYAEDRVAKAIRKSKNLQASFETQDVFNDAF